MALHSTLSGHERAREGRLHGPPDEEERLPPQQQLSSAGQQRRKAGGPHGGYRPWVGESLLTKSLSENSIPNMSFAFCKCTRFVWCVSIRDPQRHQKTRSTTFAEFNDSRSTEELRTALAVEHRHAVTTHLPPQTPGASRLWAYSWYQQRQRNGLRIGPAASTHDCRGIRPVG
jgi:hypothetical protein